MVFPSTESRRRPAPGEGEGGAAQGVRHVVVRQCTLPGYRARGLARQGASSPLHCVRSKMSVRSHTLALEMGCYDPYN